MIEFSSQASVFMFDLVGEMVNNHFADKVRSRCQILYAITHVAQSLYMIMYELFKMVSVLFFPRLSLLDFVDVLIIGFSSSKADSSTASPRFIGVPIILFLFSEADSSHPIDHLASLS